jgi:hypothetical protein
MAGAPKGNTNALKHGLYARFFTDNQRAGLRRMHWADHRHEVNAMRAHGADIYKLLQDLLSRQLNVDQFVKLSNSLATAVTATGTAARTHAGLNGEDVQLGDALSEALDDVPAFTDDRTD